MRIDTSNDTNTYRGFGKKRLLPTAVVEDLSEVPAMDENALDVFVGTANENSKAFKLDSLLIVTNIHYNSNPFNARVMASYRLC